MTLLPQRIGMYGGAFDPPHLAHVQLAQCAVAQLGLDRLLVVPTGKAWHKARDLTSAAHRLAMAHLAFDVMAQVQVDAQEALRPGNTYTIDTLRQLQAQHPAAQLYLVMGADQFAALPGWHLWQEISKIAIICVASRALDTPANPLFEPEKAPENPEKSPKIAANPVAFEPIAMPPMAISATEIRQRAALGLEISHLVNPAVARYIATHHLYQSL